VGGNFNRYWYGNDNPYSYTDPDGRAAWSGHLCDIGGCGGFVNGDPGNKPPISTADGEEQSRTPSTAGVPAPNSVPGGPWTPHDKPGQFQGPKPQDGVGGRTRLQYVPPEGEGGPPGSKGYWKVNEPGQKGWQRFDLKGNQITPEQAHPSGRVRPILPAIPAAAGSALAPFICLTCWMLTPVLEPQQNNQVY
jgi:hypothetical protein